MVYAPEVQMNADETEDMTLLLFSCIAFLIGILMASMVFELGNDTIDLDTLNEVCYRLSGGEFPIYEESYFVSLKFKCISNETIVFESKIEMGGK